MNNIKFLHILVSLWCLGQDVTNTTQTAKCPEGTYWYQSDDNNICVECPNGTFMPWKNHTAENCFDCTKIEDLAVEILIRACDRFLDADIQCVEGLYRRLARNPREKPTCLTCRPACPQHHYQVHPCQNFSDLGCCPGENYDYYIGEGGIRMCRERPWVCRRGQYLVINLNDCKPCPEKTFMPEDYHSHTECWDCRYHSDADLPLHTVITQPCTSTQSPRYGCEEGYYINHGMSYRGDDIGCSPCQTCDEGKYVGRQCDMYHDTVCCDKPNMNVVDGPQDAVCVDKIACKDGSYNPPACDKTCSQHCRVSETSDVSLCDNNNGTCLFGCMEGYTGDTCETVQDTMHSLITEERSDTNVEYVSTIVVLVFLVLVLITLVVTCVMYNKHCQGSGPRWWQRLVHHIFTQPKNTVTGDIEQFQPLVKERRRYDRKLVEDQYEVDADTNGTQLHQRIGKPKNMGENSTRKNGRSINTLKEEVQTAVEILQEITVFHCQNGIDCLTFISQNYCDHNDYRQVIGDWLADLGYAGTCIKILREELQERKLKDDKIWSVIDYTYSTCVNYSCDSTKFVKRLAESDAVHFMSNILRQQLYIDNLDRQKETQVVRHSIGVLHEIALQLGKFPVFQDCKTVEVLMTLINSNNKNIKVHAISALVDIVEEKEIESIIVKLNITSDLIDIIVDWIYQAVNNKPERRYEGIAAKTLTGLLAKLAVADANRIMIVNANTFELLFILLANAHPDRYEQYWSAKCLYQLSHDDHIRQEIREFSDLVSTMEKLKDSDYANVRQSVRLALWKIKGEEEKSSDEIKEDIKTAARRLEQMTDYQSKDAIKSLRVILHTSIDYPNYCTDIGDLLCDFSYPETCMKIVKEKLTVTNLNDTMWPVIEPAYTACWNFSFFSPKFAKRLAEVEAVQFMTNILKEKAYLDNLYRWREGHVVEGAVSVLEHIAIYVGKIPDFKDHNTVEVLMPLRDSSDHSIRIRAMIALALLEEEKETDVITSILGWLREALDNKENRTFNSITPTFFTKWLFRLMDVDAFKRKIVEAEGLHLFCKMLRDPVTSEHHQTAQCLAIMATDTSIRQEIQRFPDLVQALEDLHASDDAGVRESVATALNRIRGQV